ncbi:MAG: DegV family EDD domain-containing protein, partial [Oscillospiraceae bacterium]|nr:DegV family EDD domain-containing protein [Oscillospiraceae bacterium]
MNEFIISCCSTADLSREVLKENNIEYTCFHYNIDGKDCLDDLGETMPISEFYKKMSEGAEPTTSQVSVGQYTEFFEKFIKEGKAVLHISLSSGISGSYNSALIAKQEILDKYPDAKLTVVDSISASSGYGLLVTLAADMRAKGKSYEETIEF